MAATHNYGYFRKSNNKIILSTPDTFKFIQLFKEEENLWNTNDYRHNNKILRSQSLQEIARKMNNNWTEHQVREKILSLRSRYSKELVKVRLSITVGSEAYSPVWRFFPLLDSFLRPFCVTRKLDTEAVRHFHRRLIMGKAGGAETSSSTVVHRTCLSPTSTLQQPQDQNSPLFSSSCQIVRNGKAITSSNTHVKPDDSDDLQIISDEEMRDSNDPDIAEVYLDNDKEATSDSAPAVPGVFAGSVLVTQVKPNEQLQTQQQGSPSYLTKESSAAEQQALTGVWNQGKEGDEKLRDKESIPAAALTGTGEQNELGITEVSEAADSESNSILYKYRGENHLAHESDEQLPRKGPSVNHGKMTIFERQKHKNIPSPPPPPLPNKNLLSHNLKDLHKHRYKSSRQDALNSALSPSLFNREFQNLQGMNGLAEHVPPKRPLLAGNCSFSSNSSSDSFQQQMLQVMQIVLTSVKDQFSNEHSDEDMAFANHIACELKKLDEDLKTDVKFTIQKAIYDVQKQMNLRKQQQQ